MAAFPIASEAALDLAITEFVGVPSLDGSTADLWRAAEDEILRSDPRRFRCMTPSRYAIQSGFPAGQRRIRRAGCRCTGI